MQDNELYQHILGLSSPWTVRDVKLDMENQEIRVQVDHPRGTRFCCPECQQDLPCYDHGEERQWRHLDSCQFKTILVARVPRMDYPKHGVRFVSVPLAEPHSRFTLLFERFAMEVLQMTQAVKGAMTILRLKWDATWRIIERSSTWQSPKATVAPPRIGIDEKAFAKGQSYVSMICDLDNSTVEAISEGHDTEAAIAFFSQLSGQPIQSVEAIAMDMISAYVKAARQCIPLAEEKIFHVPFHVMKLANEALNTVRKQEHRRLLEEGDTTLSHSKYHWLTGIENHSEGQAANSVRHCFCLVVGREIGCMFAS